MRSRSGWKATVTRSPPYVCRLVHDRASQCAQMAWNFDQTILATAGMDGMVQLWKTDGELLVQLQGPSDAIEVLFALSSAQIVLTTV
jgi:WD40 repeat protein